ncbi:metallophosphoesterase [Fundidesulfovibrio soli]|uniref:metallophosphoesterase n=1 Tax=Fundidesulfovibrio soli TaxID=2922716 RepID=UPI001FB0044D|nr:metallophosphoesterase [Fundidesulfovibrio soli]
MTILGFHGAHPLLLLAFPLVPAIVLAGPVLMWRCRGRLGRDRHRLFVRLYCGLPLAALVAVALGVQDVISRLFFYLSLLAALAVLDVLLALAVMRGGRPAGGAAHDGSRRRFLAWGTVAAAGSLAVVPVLRGGEGESSPGVIERRIELTRSPKATPGKPLRLSLITDLHAGFFLPDSNLEQALALVRGFGPDVILFGGDLVEYHLETAAQTSPFFKALAAVAPVFAVLGNHDCYIDPEAVCAFHRRNGVIPLRDSRVELSGPWGRFQLCGARDYWERDRRMACLDGADPDSTLLLAHNPQSVMELPTARLPWLSLVGHTHGGQIRLPLMGPLVNQADRRLGPGLSEVDGRRIVLSAGLGFAGLPIRVDCPPDVTNVVLL